MPNPLRAPNSEGGRGTAAHAHVSDATGGHSSLESAFLQSPLTQSSEVSLRSRTGRTPSTDLRFRKDSEATGEERSQRVELLAVIARLSSALMPATERLLRLRGAVKTLQEQVVNAASTGPATTAPGTSTGTPSSPVTVSETSPSPRLCVAGVSEPDMEDVFHFLVHRDLPQHRTISTGGTSGLRVMAVSSNGSTQGGRPPTPDVGGGGALSTLQASPTNGASRRWSRLEGGGGGTAALASSATSVSAVLQTSVIVLGDPTPESPPTALPIRFPATPPLVPSPPMPSVQPSALTAATASATALDSPRTSAHRRQRSPVPVSPSLEHLPLPLSHGRVASGLHHATAPAAMLRDGAATPLHTASALLPPLHTTAPPGTLLAAATPATSPPTPTTTLTVASTSSSGAAVVGAAAAAAAAAGAAGGSGGLSNGSFGSRHAPLAPHPPVLPPPPLPAAPANHHLRTARGSTSHETPPRRAFSPTAAAAAGAAAGEAADTSAPGSPDAGVSAPVTLPSTLPAEEAATTAVGEHSSGSTPSMSRSSTMPDLPATPPPPLMGFSSPATPETSAVPLRTPSPQLRGGGGGSVSPTAPSIAGSPLLHQHHQHPQHGGGGVTTSFRRLAGGVPSTMTPVLSSPSAETPASPMPIMINTLHRTSSQFSEVAEQPPYPQRSVLGSSPPPGTARFITLPTPFLSRGAPSISGSAGRSLREDSTVLSRASSFTPPAMRFVQRVRRRMLALSALQLRLSAYDLFHRDQIGSRYRAALTSAASVSAPAVFAAPPGAASGAASPTASPTAVERGGRGLRGSGGGGGSRASSSGSRLSASRTHEQTPPPPPLPPALSSGSPRADTPTPAQPPAPPAAVSLGPHWLVGMNEDGVLRYEPLPSLAMPPPYMQCSPIAITADFALLCVPYEALLRGTGAGISRGSSFSASALLGASGSTTGISVLGSTDGDVECDEVTAALQVLFGPFAGTRAALPPSLAHSPLRHAHGSPSPMVVPAPPHTSRAMSRSTGGTGGTAAAAPVAASKASILVTVAPSAVPELASPPGSIVVPPVTAYGEALPLPTLCRDATDVSAEDSDEEGGSAAPARRESRRGTYSFPSYPHVSTATTAAETDKSPPSSPLLRASTAGTMDVSVSGNGVPFTASKRLDSVGSPSQDSLPPPAPANSAAAAAFATTTPPPPPPPPRQASWAAPPSSAPAEEWLRPLRQALVDRTIFLLVKSDSAEAASPNRPRNFLSSPNPGASLGDRSDESAADEMVVRRFVRLAKLRYGVSVPLWRVIVFNCRDAARARAVMLAAYAQQVGRPPRRSPQSPPHPTPTPPPPPQAVPPGSGAASISPTSSFIGRGGARQPSVSPVERTTSPPTLVSPGAGAAHTAANGAAAPSTGWPSLGSGASLTSTSRLTLTSPLGGATDARRAVRLDDSGHSAGRSSDAGEAEGPGELGDPLFALLTQDLRVPPLGAALEQYRLLLDSPVAAPSVSRMSVLSGGGVAASAAPGGGDVSAANTLHAVPHLGSPLSVPSPPATDEAPMHLLLEAEHRPPRVVGSLVPADFTDDRAEGEVDGAAVRAACAHAQDVTWRVSGAAALGKAVRYFQHAAATHRVARAALPVMTWSWQLSALLPVIIKDTQTRCNRLRHNRRHAQHKLQTVRRSVQLHLAASPAKTVAALQVRLQAGFKDMAQRFLRDLRHLFITVGMPSVTSPVESPSNAAHFHANGSRTPPAPAFPPLDALLAYDSPGLREAYRRLAGAVHQFCAFYIAGQFPFEGPAAASTAPAAVVPPLGVRNGVNGAAWSAQPHRSVFEQRYAALRDTAVEGGAAPAANTNDGSAAPPPPPQDTATRPGTPATAAAAVTALTPTPPCSTSPAAKSPRNGRRHPSVTIATAVAADAAASGDAPQSPMAKVDFGDAPRPRRLSLIASAAGSSASSGDSTASSSPAHDAAGLAGHGQPQRLCQVYSTPALYGPSSERRLTTSSSTPNLMGKGDRVDAPRRSSSRLPQSQQAGRPEDAARAKRDSAVPRLVREEVQRLRMSMEHQLIAHVSQVNTEVINFLLATCAAAVPHLQRDCVGVELSRVRDVQAEIVSSFTTAVRGRKDAAIAMAHLYAKLEKWGADMAHLVSLVRSRAYLEKFITQLRAVLCEDEVRGLAVFRGQHVGSGPHEGAGDAGDAAGAAAAAAASAAPPAGTGTLPAPLPLPSRKPVASRPPLLRGSLSGEPVPLAEAQGANALATEVGHRAARMLCYYTRVACKPRSAGESGHRLSDAGIAPTGLRSGVFGDVLTSSPSRSLRSVNGAGGSGSPNSSSRRSSRVRSGGPTGSSGSLLSMSAAWNREEERSRGERVYGSGANATAASAFFAAPRQPAMAAIAADALALLEGPAEPPPPRSRRASASSVVGSGAVPASASRTAVAVDGASPKVPLGEPLTHDRKRTLSPSDNALTHHVVPPPQAPLSQAPPPQAPLPQAPPSEEAPKSESAWLWQLAQWRSAMSGAERPADASAAPLLWILLDAWDETLLRMPFGLLLHVDTARYAESLNSMSGELMETQHSWVRRCEETLHSAERQLTAMQADLERLSDDNGEPRGEYVRELRSIFEQAAALVAVGDDALHERILAF